METIPTGEGEAVGVVLVFFGRGHRPLHQSSVAQRVVGDDLLKQLTHLERRRNAVRI